MIHHKPFCRINAGVGLHFTGADECSCGAIRKEQRGRLPRVSYLRLVNDLEADLREEFKELKKLAIESSSSGSIDEDAILGTVARMEESLKEYRQQVIDQVAQIALPGI